MFELMFNDLLKNSMGTAAISKVTTVDKQREHQKEDEVLCTHQQRNRLLQQR